MAGAREQGLAGRAGPERKLTLVCVRGLDKRTAEQLRSEPTWRQGPRLR